MDHGSFDGHGHDGHSGMDAITGHFSGLDFGFGHGGHGHDGQATHDALIVAHSFTGHGGHGHGMGVDNSVSLDGHFGHHGNMSAIGASFTGALDVSKEAFGIAVVGHNYLDLRGLVREALIAQGLLELFTPQGDRKRIDQQYKVIKPVRAATQSKTEILPDGCYTGATGLTTEWRSFWQIGEQTFMDKLRGIPRSRNPKARWNIDVSITQWYYTESGDYETRILANVWSGFMNSTTDMAERTAHLKVAREFIKQMAELLASKAPSEHSRKFRAALNQSVQVKVVDGAQVD